MRLRALRDAPEAFGTTWEDARAWPSQRWAALLAEMAFFVAVRDGTDVGMVRGGGDATDPATAWLGSLWVDPAARGSSAGRLLVEAVVAWARTARFQELVLDVRDDNRAAIAMYARLGFEPTGWTGAMPPPRERFTTHRRRLRL